MTNIVSAELQDLIALRGETPVMLEKSPNGHQLYRFTDGSEVAVTVAGVITEKDDGFAELRDSILRTK